MSWVRGERHVFGGQSAHLDDRAARAARRRTRAAAPSAPRRPRKRHQTRLRSALPPGPRGMDPRGRGSGPSPAGRRWSVGQQPRRSTRPARAKGVRAVIARSRPIVPRRSRGPAGRPPSRHGGPRGARPQTAPSSRPLRRRGRGQDAALVGPHREELRERAVGRWRGARCPADGAPAEIAVSAAAVCAAIAAPGRVHRDAGAHGRSGHVVGQGDNRRRKLVPQLVPQDEGREGTNSRRTCSNTIPACSSCCG